MDVDVAIVGAGPAGLSAAVAAGEAGCGVLIVDAYAQPGGQYFKQLPREFHARAPHALHHEPAAAHDLFHRVGGIPAIAVLSGSSVWAAERRPRAGGPFTLHLHGPEGASQVRTDVVILAPGAYDRALPFPGWDLPGVMTVGAAQTLIKSQRVLPGRRVVLSGSGPFLLPVAAGLAQAGAQVVAVCEAGAPLWARPWSAARLLGHPDKLVEGLDYLRTLRKHRVPIRYNHAVTRVRGGDRVESVTVQRLDGQWVPVPGSEEEVRADAVCLGYGFMPSTELSYSLGCSHIYDPVQGAAFARHDDDMQSTEAGIFVAGEITGVRGSAVALAQGSLAGLAAARDLGRLTRDEAERRMARWRTTYEHRRAFGDALMRLYAVRPGWTTWSTPDTIVCRCEEVTVEHVHEAVKRYQARDVKGVKSLTRCGMGPCQGRVCTYAVTTLTARFSGRAPAEVGSFTGAPIARPTLIGDLL